MGARIPQVAVVDDEGGIYALDILNSRLLKFQLKAPWPVGSRGTPTPRPATPTPLPTSTATPSTALFITPTDR